MKEKGGQKLVEITVKLCFHFYFLFVCLFSEVQNLISTLKLPNLLVNIAATLEICICLEQIRRPVTKQQLSIVFAFIYRRILKCFALCV